MIAVLGSAHVVLAMTEDVVTAFGLGGSMIGVMTLGVAAALPELTTIMKSVKRGSPNIALGTVIGSNIVNPLLGIGIGGVLSTYAVPDPVILWDLPFKLIIGIGVLVYLLVFSDMTFRRREGIKFILLYLVFIAVRFPFFAVPQG